MAGLAVSPHEVHTQVSDVLIMNQLGAHKPQEEVLGLGN